MTHPGTAEVRWPRLYRMLRAAGHDPAKATEILLDAQRKDNHALTWIKAVLPMSAAMSILEAEQDHRMSVEYDWTSNTYRSRLGDAFTPVDGWRSFETLAAARHQLRLVGLRLGTKTDPRTWRVEVMELV